MNSKIWRNTIIGIVAALTVTISVEPTIAQSKKDLQKACDKAQEEADNAKEEADKAEEAADNAPKSDADKGADTADQKAEKDEQDYRDAQEKADKSQADVDKNVPGSGEQARKDQEAADKARDKAQDSENKADAADKKADKGKAKDDPQKVNRQKQKKKRQKAQEAWDKCRKLKALTVSMGFPPNAVGNYVASGQVAVAISGTGETIGQIATMTLQNLTDQAISCVVPPMILESSSGKNQNYVCPKGQNVAVNAHGSVSIPINGVCVNRNKPPVGSGVGGDLVMNPGNPNVPTDPACHIPPNDAQKLLRSCAAKYDAVDKLQKDGALTDMPYKDKQKRKDICVQWSTWSDPEICNLTGAPPATKDDLKKVVYKQLPEPMSSTDKKKIDNGIDTIFEKVELTTAKAKDLEKGGESTTEQGKRRDYATRATEISSLVVL